MSARSACVVAILAAFLLGFLAGGSVVYRESVVWAGAVAPCEIGDLNGDSQADVSDAVYLLQYLFLGGPPPRPCGADSLPVSTAIVVRHGERFAFAEDCPPTCPVECINEEGRERAERLADILADLETENLHLIASDLCRTRETLEPAAARLGGLPIEEIADGADVADRIRELPQGSISVVAHHSFTIHDILRGLGLEGVETIPVGGQNYDNFFVVLLPPKGNAQLVRLHY